MEVAVHAENESAIFAPCLIHVDVTQSVQSDSSLSLSAELMCKYVDIQPSKLFDYTDLKFT